MKLCDISGILFDLDGTLSDYHSSSMTGLREALDVYNADRDNPLDWEIFLEAFNAVIETESVWTSSHGLSAPAKETRIRRFQTLFRSLGLPVETNIAEMADAYGNGRSKGAKLFPDVLPALDYLKNKYALAILTEGSVKTQMDQIKQLRIEEYFSNIIVSGQTPWHKPDLSLFEFASVKMELEPAMIVFIGDRLDWDIQPASSVGMNTVYVNRVPGDDHLQHPVCRPDVIIRSLTELIQLL